MESLLENLPTWGLLILGVVWLAFQFVQKFIEKQEAKRESEARKEFRARKGHSEPPFASVGQNGSRLSDETGKHNLRRIYDEEREREQRSEILTNSRQHSALLRELVTAETVERDLLQKLVEVQDRQGRVLEGVAETQRAIVRFLSRRDDQPTPGATLREINGYREGSEG